MIWRTVLWRSTVFIIGTTLLLVGIVMIVFPGPALIVIPLSLEILSWEFKWARSLKGLVQPYIGRALAKVRERISYRK